MSPCSLTRTQRRAIEMRRQLIEIASAIVAERGPSALSSEEVARRADVSVQTVYNRVGGRAALLTAITEAALEANRTFMDAAYDSPGTPVERIERAGLAYASFALQRPHAFQVLLHPPGEPDAMARVASLIDEQNAKLSAALREAQAQGIGRLDIDPDQTAAALWGMMNGVLNLATRTDALKVEGPAVASLVGTALALIRSGLLHAAESADAPALSTSIPASPAAGA